MSGFDLNKSGLVACHVKQRNDVYMPTSKKRASQSCAFGTFAERGHGEEIVGYCQPLFMAAEPLPLPKMLA